MKKYMGMMVVGLMLVGCGSLVVVKSGTPTDEAKVKQFTPEAARALVYVYRDNSFLGSSAKSQFVVNHVAVAKNEKGSFHIVSLAPGAYEVMSLSSDEGNVSTTLIHNSKKVAVHLTAEAGKIYYFQEVFKPASGFSLKAASAEEAQAFIKKAKYLTRTQF